MKQEYKIYLTPLVKLNTYGSQIDITQDIDISDFILNNGLGKITQQVDYGDYDINRFTFGNVRLKCLNFDNKFSDNYNPFSFFQFSRDKAKVEIYYLDEEHNENLVFRGLINDEYTKEDPFKQTVDLQLLSFESILRKIIIRGGLINSTMLFSTAIKAILNKPEVSAVLNYDPVNINCDIDERVDDGNFFDNITAKEALEYLLQASNSISIIDVDGNIIVKSREENSNDIYEFYSGDLFNSDNIINIKGFNNGLQRAFNSVQIEEDTYSDDDFVNEFGLRQKKLDEIGEFITLERKRLAIAKRIVDEFKQPRIEFEIIVEPKYAKGVKLLDRCKVKFLKRHKRYKNNELPYADVALADSAVCGYYQGGIEINDTIIFKVIAITFNPQKFQTILKLRAKGKLSGSEALT